jgi:hypothetical protein
MCHNKGMKKTLFFCFLWVTFLFTFLNQSEGVEGKAKSKESLKKELDSIFDPHFNYSKFSGRMTDRDKVGNIIKIYSENKNIKFFRPGDLVEFRLVRLNDNLCRGYIKSVEERYFTLYVKDLFRCWKKSSYLRRGTQMVFYSAVLSERVKDAGLFRIILIKKRMEYWGQLKKLNQFIWTYDQKKIYLSSSYDKKIVELETQKRRELDVLLGKKSDQVLLQKEIIKKIDQVNSDLGHYKIEHYEPELDRWHLDHDLGLPVGRRPQGMKGKMP